MTMDIEDCIMRGVRKMLGVRAAITKADALRIAIDDYTSDGGSPPKERLIEQYLKTIKIVLYQEIRGGRFSYIIDVQTGVIIQRE